MSRTRMGLFVAMSVLWAQAVEAEPVPESGQAPPAPAAQAAGDPEAAPAPIRNPETAAAAVADTGSSAAPICHCVICRRQRSLQPEAGYYLDAWRMRLRDQASARRFVLYQYDFLPRRAALNSAGLRRLERIRTRLIRSVHPLRIESSGDSDLDQSRLNTVHSVLKRQGYQVPVERMVLRGAEPPHLTPADITRLRESGRIEINLSTSSSAAGSGTTGQ